MSLPGPAYRIETERLVIRCYQPTDAAIMKEAVDASIEHLRPWLPWAANEPQDLDTKVTLMRRFRGRFDLGEDFVYGIFNQDETQCLGGTGLHTRLGPQAREIGYWVRADVINRGIGTENAAALTKVGFEVEGLERIEIHCDALNVRSAAVPRKLGYTLEATLRNRLGDIGGVWRDVMIWTLFKADYPNTPAARAKVKAYDALGRSLLE